jgi:hypothetical protein
MAPGHADHRTRQVDVYAAEHWLTCDDHNVYVPQFVESLRQDIGELLFGDACRRRRRPYPDCSPEENHRRLLAQAEAGDNSRFLELYFMDWGPTADNVSATLFLEDGVAFMPFSFWRPEHHDPTELGKIFVAELPERELLHILHEAAWELAIPQRDWTIPPAE